MSTTHVDHCRTHVILGAECTCDQPAYVDQERPLCTVPTPRDAQLAKLDAVVQRITDDKAQYTDGQYDQSIRDREFLLELLAATPLLSTDAPTCTTIHPTGAQLDALPPGRRLVDHTGDAWFKLPDGRWSFKNVTTSSAAHLVEVWGPLRLLPEVSE